MIRTTLTPVRAACALLVLALAGCSSLNDALSGDKIDYRSQATKTAPLDIPPDLTQLARDGRYQPQSNGTVSASAMQVSANTSPAAAQTPAVVAPTGVATLKVERQGNQRWLVSSQSPEELWPQLRAFWQERGFTLALENADTGVMETDWAENRAKLQQDGVRRALGGLLDSFFSTGERDRFRTRVERVAGGSEVFISHNGMEEVYQGERKERTVWQKRAPDPQLEAEMLSRLMVKLGAKPEEAKTQVATAKEAPAHARALTGAVAALEVDDTFDRAWRRVGIALDRTGFTVEDRDRAGGLYYVRYVDPKLAGREEPGFFSRLFGGDKAAQAALQRYRIAMKADGDKTQLTVQTAQGSTDTGEAGQRIVKTLVDELK